MAPISKPPRVISMDEIDPGLDAGTTHLCSISLQTFRDVLAGKHPALQVNIDATRMTQAFIGANYIQSIVTGKSPSLPSAIEPGPCCRLRSRHVKFNPNLNGIWLAA